MEVATTGRIEVNQKAALALDLTGAEAAAPRELSARRPQGSLR
jgi:hypothetical protein